MGGWQDAATKDPEIAGRMWHSHKNANVGVATGKKSEVWVLDVDPKDGGLESLSRLEAQYGEIPETWTSVTGGGGKHYFFKYEEGIGNAVGKNGGIAPGLDTRSDGGLVVAPGSIHGSGNPYQWDPTFAPGVVELAPAPAWLSTLVKRAAGKKVEAATGQVFNEGWAGSIDLSQVSGGECYAERDPIEDGCRDETLFQVARGMHEDGLSEVEVAAVIVAIDQRHVVPPLGEKEALLKAAQGLKYALSKENRIDDALDWLKRLERENRLKRDALERRTLAALNVLRMCDQAEYVRWRNRLKGLRLSVREIEGMYQTLNMPLVGDLAVCEPSGENAAGMNRRVMASMLGEVPGNHGERYVIPEPYTLNEQSLITAGQDKFGMPVFNTIAFAPVVISGRLKDIDGGGVSLRLAWKRQGRWVEKVVPRDVAMTSRKLLELSAVDFPVTERNAKDLTTYLDKLEAVNQSVLPFCNVSSHLGWQGRSGSAGFLWGRQLVLPTGEILTTVDPGEARVEEWREDLVSFRGADDGDEQLSAGFHAAGTLEKWTQAVEAIQNHPRVLFGFYASFVTPLLEILGCSNFVVDWANRTSTGKTTTLRVVASVWGNPDDRDNDSIIGSWDTTRVYAERACSVLTGLPFILDDTKRSKDPTTVAEIIYLATNGRGKGRGTIKGVAATATWRTVLFSTGEAPATSFTQDGGARTRCLVIRGVPFDKDDQESRKKVNTLTSGLSMNYGHAGPKFIQWLYENQEKWGDIKEGFQALKEQIADEGDGAEVGRVAEYYAAVVAAAQLVHSALDLPWEFGDEAYARLGTVWSDVASEAKGASGEKRALLDIVSWCYARPSDFKGRHIFDYQSEPRQPLGGWAGRWDPNREDAPWESICFYPNRLEKILRDFGYEPTAILHGWAEAGWLEVDKDRKTKQIRDEGDRVRMYVIKRSAVDAVDGANFDPEDFVPPVEREER